MPTLTTVAQPHIGTHGRFEAGDGDGEGAGEGGHTGKGKSFYDDAKSELDRQMQANRDEFAGDAPETRALFEGCGSRARTLPRRHLCDPLT